MTKTLIYVMDYGFVEFWVDGDMLHSRVLDVYNFDGENYVFMNCSEEYSENAWEDPDEEEPIRIGDEFFPELDTWDILNGILFPHLNIPHDPTWVTICRG